MMNECTLGLSLGTLAVLTSASVASAQIRYGEATFQAQCAVWVDAMPDPLFDSDMATGDERAETQARISGPIFMPFMDARAESSGGSGIYASLLDLEIDDGSPLSAPLRWAEGSWSHRAAFELATHSHVQISVNPGGFRDIEYAALEPCTLTGPDGVVVSGAPEPGLAAWTWVLDLPPGRYTYEASAAYRAEIDGIEGLNDRASHFVRISYFGRSCPADIDADGELTIFDFLTFQNLFDAGDLAADFDDDGELTLFDFLAFQNAFDAGCS